MTAELAEASLAERFAALPDRVRRRQLSRLGPDDLAALAYDWSYHARPKQLAPPGDWSIWLVMAGRGFGKTRTGAEWVRQQVAAGRRRIALVGPTAADVRDVMILGPSGILACCPDWDRPKYEPSKRVVTWPNGAEAHAYSADEPNRLRGPEHDAAWADELAAWRYLDLAWGVTGLAGGLRIGPNPQVVATTTPRPLPAIKELIRDRSVAVTRGSTYENASNLAPIFLRRILEKYEGTRLGRQELRAEILEAVLGALWTLDTIERHRVPAALPREAFARVVVAIDPPKESPDTAADPDAVAECGIIVAARDLAGRGYVLEDASRPASPLQWAALAVALYDEYRADRIVIEDNVGGEMCESTIRTVDPRAAVSRVTATRGKLTRAEPVSSLYEQGKVSHVGGFPQLEDQMTTWVPGMKSPDRMDALVWALTELMLGPAQDPVRVW